MHPASRQSRHGFSRKLFISLIVGVAVVIVGALSPLEAWPDAATSGVKVAVAAMGKEGSSRVGPTATRSPYYLIFDGSGSLLEVIENPYTQTIRGSGACVDAMEMLADKRVTHIVAGAFGDRTSETIRALGIHQIQYSGSVRDASQAAITKIAPFR